MSLFVSFRTLCLLLSCGGLFVWEVLLCLGLSISESLSGSCALFKAAQMFTSCLVMRMTRKKYNLEVNFASYR